jgi:hypothetical protein
LEITSNVPDYFPSKEPIEKLFVLLSGKESMPKKVEILNNMLIDWVKDKRLVTLPRIGNIYPAPSSLNTMVQTLFAAAKDYYKWEFATKDFSSSQTICNNNNNDHAIATLWQQVR